MSINFFSNSDLSETETKVTFQDLPDSSLEEFENLIKNIVDINARNTSKIQEQIEGIVTFYSNQQKILEAFEKFLKTDLNIDKIGQVLFIFDINIPSEEKDLSSLQTKFKGLFTYILDNFGLNEISGFLFKDGKKSKDENDQIATSLKNTALEIVKQFSIIHHIKKRKTFVEEFQNKSKTVLEKIEKKAKVTNQELSEIFNIIKKLDSKFEETDEKSPNNSDSSGVKTSKEANREKKGIQEKKNKIYITSQSDQSAEVVCILGDAIGNGNLSNFSLFFDSESERVSLKANVVNTYGRSKGPFTNIQTVFSLPPEGRTDFVFYINNSNVYDIPSKKNLFKSLTGIVYKNHDYYMYYWKFVLYILFIIVALVVVGFLIYKKFIKKEEGNLLFDIEKELEENGIVVKKNLNETSTEEKVNDIEEFYYEEDEQTEEKAQEELNFAQVLPEFLEVVS